MSLNPSKEARQFVGRHDRAVINEDESDVILIDEFGIKIIYEESVNDLLELEEELIKLGTFFITQNEFVGGNDQEEP